MPVINFKNHAEITKGIYFRIAESPLRGRADEKSFVEGVLAIFRKLFLAVLLAWFGLATGNAQLIYSNAFNGGTTSINATAPTVATGLAGGISSAIWNDALGTNNTGVLQANGADSSTLGDSWLLPFYPQSGYVYTLTASLTFTGNPGNWVGLGFAQNDSLNVPVGDGRFADSGAGGPTGYDFMILTESSGSVSYFTGPKANSPSIFSGTGFSGGPQTLALTVILNTTSSLWSMTAYVNGGQIGSTTSYAANPPIGAVGITQTTLGAPAAVHWNFLALQATGNGPITNTINASVDFSSTNLGLPLNPSFNGLSYEKLAVAEGYFNSNNASLVKLFSQIGPAVLRIGGGTVDQTGWGGLSNTIPITTAAVDTLAGFMKALPTNWSVIYGLNLLSNTPANCAAEAAYAVNALGSCLLGFEIGNEPEGSFSSYSSFLARWQPLAAAVTNGVPGWAATNGGNGWVLTGADVGQGNYTTYTDPFASAESGVVALLTQHYYRAAGGSTNDTMQLLFQTDTKVLLPMMTNIVSAATGHCPLGARISEAGSYSEGGVAGVSDAFGAALWSLDFLFTTALTGGQGVNFHGGGYSPYSPLVDNGTNVISVGPEFYGLKLFSLLPAGSVIPGSVVPASFSNFTAYGVRQTNGTVSAVLDNKYSSNLMVAKINLGTNVIGAQVIELTGPSLYNTGGFAIGGAPIKLDGTWNGGVQSVLTATNGQLTANVPPNSAFLLIPEAGLPEISITVTGSLLTLSWPANYIGWLLETNAADLTTTNWFPVPASVSTNSWQTVIQPTLSNVYYRLIFPSF